MAREDLTVHDESNASDYNMFNFDDGLEAMLDNDFENQLGAQFAGYDSGLGGSGTYPDLESEEQLSDVGPYFVGGQLQDAFAAAQRSSQLVIPGSGRPDLIRDIATDMPALSSNTPSISELSGDAPTPPGTPSGMPLIPLKKGYERVSAIKRKNQQCQCVFPECNNKTFTRQDGLQRHYESRHNLAEEHFECTYCGKVDVRLDKAKTHWRNIHERQGFVFQPQRVEKAIDARAAELYAAALKNRSGP